MERDHDDAKSQPAQPQAQAHGALQLQADILRVILDGMTEGVIVCDASGQLLLVNESARRMLRFEECPTRLSQLSAALAAPDDDRAGVCAWHQHPLVRALQGETVADCELSLYDRRRGLSVTFNHSSAPLRDSGGIGPELDEDYSTSMIMTAHGWRGVFAIDAIASGDGPVTFEDAMRQECVGGAAGTGGG